MPWNNNWPDGTQSVKQNRPTGQQNTNYIQTEMNKDHFWNSGVNQDGHHKWAQMVATNDADKSLQTNASNATDIDLTYFNRYKTPTESTFQQSSEAFAVSQRSIAPFTQDILQLLGIRAMAVFNSVPGNVPQTLVYSFNVTNVIRQTTGRYEMNYTNLLPSRDYAVLGGCMLQTVDSTFTPTFLSVTSGSSVAARKSFDRVIFLTALGNGTLVDCMQNWLICFGG